MWGPQCSRFPSQHLQVKPLQRPKIRTVRKVVPSLRLRLFRSLVSQMFKLSSVRLMALLLMLQVGNRLQFGQTFKLPLFA